MQRRVQSSSNTLGPARGIQRFTSLDVLHKMRGISGQRFTAFIANEEDEDDSDTE